LGGIAAKAPWLATFIMIGFMASLGLPASSDSCRVHHILPPGRPGTTCRCCR
jgi:hypothetical protein